MSVHRPGVFDGAAILGGLLIDDHCRSPDPVEFCRSRLMIETFKSAGPKIIISRYFCVPTPNAENPLPEPSPAHQETTPQTR